MNVKEWLKSGVHYDQSGAFIWTNNNRHVLDMRGWGELTHFFETPEEAVKFQDEIGEFVAQAINEKFW